jgi:hypothetical protein
VIGPGGADGEAFTPLFKGRIESLKAEAETEEENCPRQGAKGMMREGKAQGKERTRMKDGAVQEKRPRHQRHQRRKVK